MIACTYGIRTHQTKIKNAGDHSCFAANLPDFCGLAEPQDGPVVAGTIENGVDDHQPEWHRYLKDIKALVCIKESTQKHLDIIIAGNEWKQLCINNLELSLEKCASLM